MILLGLREIKKRESAKNIVFLLCKQKQIPPLMNTTKIQTKRILSEVSRNFLHTHILTLPETRCLKEMTVGILKSKTVFVNQIAASLRESIPLRKTAKGLSAQYLKDDYAERIRANHLEQVTINQEDFIAIDGSDIIKKYAKCMEGLEYVRDGDTGEIGLGYNFINLNAIDGEGDITPLFSKAYSFEMGDYSLNNEIKKAVGSVRERFDSKGTFVIDREADGEILKDFFFSLPNQCIMRLKRNTSITYKGEKLQVSKMVKKMHFNVEQKVTKIRKNKKIVQSYELAAVQVSFEARRKTHSAWLIISRNKKHGGLCYLLVKSNKETALEVVRWAFEGYGKRWKIEEYHRHIKQAYRLEDIQMKTFNGLQSMLAILSIAMYILYKKISALHVKLLLESGYNYLNKHRISELTNFIYYKLTKIVSNLLIPVKLRWKIERTPLDDNLGQLNLMFN